jgi:Flp pilus assembly protein TadD
MNNLAIALARNGRMEEGETLLERATELRPDFEPARDNLARMRALMGEQ